MIQNSKIQLIDYYYINDLSKGCAQRIRKILQENHNIYLTYKYIQQRISQITKGEVVISPAAEFNGIPGGREGKDMNYAGLWTLIDILLPDVYSRSYLGLASNQIDKIRDKVKNQVVVCERDEKIYFKLTQLKDLIAQTKSFHMSKILVIHSDIFEYMEATKETFNIIDLDLMCNIPLKSFQLIHWCKLLNKVSKDIVIVSITNTIGRNITKVQHQQQINTFKNYLKRYFIVSNSEFAYQDRRIPMRTNRMLLKRKRCNNE